MTIADVASMAGWSTATVARKMRRPELKFPRPLFAPQISKLNLSAYNGSGVTWTITQSGADALFAFTNGDQITLLGVIAANLVQTDPFGYS